MRATYKIAFRRLFLGSVILLLPSSLAAQRRNMAPRPVSASVRPQMTPVVRGGGDANVVTIIINNNTPAPVSGPFFSTDFIPVPGLGFDIPHLAAVGGPAAVGAASSLSRGVSTGVRFLNAGFFLPAAPVIVLQVPPIVIEQPVIVQPQPQAAAPEPAPAKEAPAEEPAAKAVRETPEYVFVRRDGLLLFAVAFLSASEHLDYITREGQRRRVPLSALDLEATQRFNEERGLTFRLPS